MVGSGNPAATHCSMPFMSLSRVRISGFAAGRDKWPYVRLLENLTNAHSTLSESSKNFLEAEGYPEEHVVQRGESEPVSGRHREGRCEGLTKKGFPG